MIGSLPPGLILLAGALILPLLPKALRAWAFLLFPLAALGQIAGLEEGQSITLSFLTFELEPLRVDRLSLVFGWIFALVAFVGGLYAMHLKDTGQQVSALIYAGAALGAIFAGDLLTLFVWWEIMAFSAAVLVWARRTPESYRSAMRYLFYHVVGGALLMGGILWHVGETGSLAFQAFEGGWPTYLILLGFAVNAAVVPLHAWIADAYPQGTVTGSVFLSAFTTKTAVYALARGFAGWEILVFAGVLMTIYGVVYAVLANDIRRILSYHIVSQVGFMVAGIGVGSELALNGATSHAFTHILYKGLLFMATGAVLYSTGRSKLTELGGLARALPWTFAFYMVAALSISSAPFFSGFVSKPMTIDAVGYGGYPVSTLLLYLASVGTFLSVGLKLPWFTWLGESKEPIEVKPLPWGMYAGMGLGAALNIWLGVHPGPLYGILPYEVAFDPYTLKTLNKGFQLLLFTGLGFAVLFNVLKPKDRMQLDLDWIYRRPARASFYLVPASVARVFGTVESGVYALMGASVRVGRDPVGWARRKLGARPAEAGIETDSTAFRVTMTAMVTVLLFMLLLFMFRILS
jgi:multicomponent Na+:H+ antiporter subunit D